MCMHKNKNKNSIKSWDDVTVATFPLHVHLVTEIKFGAAIQLTDLIFPNGAFSWSCSFFLLDNNNKSDDIKWTEYFIDLRNVENNSRTQHHVEMNSSNI